MHRLFFYLLILFLPTQLGLHVWPDWAMVLGRRVDYLSPTLYLTDIFVFLTLSFFVLPKFFEFIFLLERKPLPSLYSLLFSHPTVSCLLFAIYCLLNITHAPSPTLALYSWTKILEMILLGGYIIKTKPPLRTIANLLSISALFSLGIGMWQIRSGGSIGGIFWLLGERTFTLDAPNIAKGIICIPFLKNGCIEYLRPYATFPHPNVFAGFLGITLILVYRISHITHRSSKSYFAALRYTMYVCFLGLLLSFSRSAWIALIIHFFLLTKNKSKKMLYSLTGIFLLVFLFLLAYPLPVLETHESFAVRQQLNTAAMRIIQNNVLFGVGAGNFLPAIPSFLPSRTIYFLQPVHNIFLLFLAEHGVTGLIFITFALWKLMQYSRLSRAIQSSLSSHPLISSPIKALVTAGHSSPLLFLLVVGLFDHYPLTLQQGQLLLTLSISMMFL